MPTDTSVNSMAASAATPPCFRAGISFTTFMLITIILQVAKGVHETEDTQPDCPPFFRCTSSGGCIYGPLHPSPPLLLVCDTLNLLRRTNIGVLFLVQACGVRTHALEQGAPSDPGNQDGSKQCRQGRQCQGPYRDGHLVLLRACGGSPPGRRPHQPMKPAARDAPVGLTRMRRGNNGGNQSFKGDFHDCGIFSGTQRHPYG